MKSSKISVTGKVQGVYFRASAKQKAMNLGVNGYIKNELDGTVTLVVEGDEKAVKSMTEWCKHGPGLAHVKGLLKEDCAARNFISFEIRK